MRLSFIKIGICSFALAVLGYAAFQIFSINQSAQKTLADSRIRQTEQNRATFQRKLLTPATAKNVGIIQNTSDVRSFVIFRDFYYAATGGGLVQFSADGKFLKHFTILDGLPESDLTALAVYRDRLYIGTRTKNLIVFDGEKFESIVWTDRQAQAVTAFLETNEKLLIGTFGGGLLEYNGENFTEIKAEKTRIGAVNCLYQDGASLYVGTFADGLWIYENDTWRHFKSSEGLPSNRVVGIVSKDKNLYAATDFGLAIRQKNNFHTLAVLPTLSSAVLRGNEIYVTKDSGEIYTFDNSLQAFSEKGNLQNARLTSTGEKLWLISNQGVSELKGKQIKSFNATENKSLTDNFISALAFDGRGNLWVGTFRNGIDVFSAEGKKIKHIESEIAREINFLHSNGETVVAATAAGLQTYRSDFSAVNLTKKDGLPSASVMHVEGDYIATTKGLAFRENGAIRVLSTVQNLPNNSVFATAEVGKKLYAGTLGGLAEIEGKRVVRIYKDSNSRLATNWVTALIYTGERLFIGTYGGGIFELLPSGEVRSFESETGKFVVNPNALFSDGERLYAGTLAGVKVLDLRTQEWKTVKRILPAETVMSITGDEKNIYFGTTNGIARVGKELFEQGEIE